MDPRDKFAQLQQVMGREAMSSPDSQEAEASRLAEMAKMEEEMQRRLLEQKLSEQYDLDAQGQPQFVDNDFRRDAPDNPRLNFDQREEALRAREEVQNPEALQELLNRYRK